MYTHYTGVSVLAGQAVWALAYHRDRWRPLIASNVAAAVGWLPWLSSYQADRASDATGSIGFLQPFGLDAVKTDVLHWTVGHPLPVFSVREVPGDWALAAIALAVVAGLAGIAFDVVRRRVGLMLPGERVALVLVLALSTPVLAGIYSAVGESVFYPRNLIASTPGFALALGLLVCAPRQRALQMAATVFLVGGFAIAGTRMLEDESHRPDAKGIANFITEHDGSAAGPSTRP